MCAHAGALLISELTYRCARRHAHDPRFSFGTGNPGDPADFAGAIAPAIVAPMIAFESAQRLLAPAPIHFSRAMGVAIIGPAVNLLSAWLLRDEHHHASHGHDHDHAHRHDNNLQAAYPHVATHALTSAPAIAALLLGSMFSRV